MQRGKNKLIFGTVEANQKYTHLLYTFDQTPITQNDVTSGSDLRGACVTNGQTDRDLDSKCRSSLRCGAKKICLLKPDSQLHSKISAGKLFQVSESDAAH